MESEYTLALGIIRRTVLDALNGYGTETLAALFYPTSQSAIARMLEVDEDIALQRTLRACLSLISLDESKRQAVRHALTWASLAKLEEALNANG